MPLVFLPEATATEPLPQRIDYKHQTALACAVIQQVHQKQLSLAEGIRELNDCLQDFTHENGPEASLSNFVTNIMALNKDDFYLDEPEDKGFSKDKVLVVRDKWTSASILVLKMFLENSPNFIPEIYSLQFLTEARISGFASPEIYALGRCHVGGGRFFILAETAASGHSFLHFCRKHAAFDPGSRDRKLSLETFIQGVKKVGRSLAQLHTYRRGQFKQLPEEFTTRVDGYLKTSVEKLKSHPQEGIDPELLEKCYRRAQTQFESEARTTSIVHGDTKFQNIFFDPIQLEITWIDPSKLADSMDAGDQPIGCAAKDIGSFLASFREWQTDFVLTEQKSVVSKQLLGEEEIVELHHAFFAGYKEITGSDFPQSDLDFYSFAGKLYYFAQDRSHEPDARIEEPFASRRHHKMASITEDLRNKLHGQKSNYY